MAQRLQDRYGPQPIGGQRRVYQQDSVNLNSNSGAAIKIAVNTIAEYCLERGCGRNWTQHITTFLTDWSLAARLALNMGRLTPKLMNQIQAGNADAYLRNLLNGFKKQFHCAKAACYTRLIFDPVPGHIYQPNGNIRIPSWIDHPRITLELLARRTTGNFNGQIT